MATGGFSLATVCFLAANGTDEVWADVPVVDPDTGEPSEAVREELWRIFSHYTTKLSPTDVHRLSMLEFLNLMRDCGLHDEEICGGRPAEDARHSFGSSSRGLPWGGTSPSLRSAASPPQRPSRCASSSTASGSVSHRALIAWWT